MSNMKGSDDMPTDFSDEDAPAEEPDYALVAEARQPTPEAGASGGGDNLYKAAEDPRNDELLYIDIVHVTVNCVDDDMDWNVHDFQVSDTTDKREFIYRVNMAKLLVGDLTDESVRQQADQLLRGLAKQSPPRAMGLWNPRRSIIFVAYDFGGLVVKMAAYLAAHFQQDYPGIFWDIAQIVFSGCPHRSLDLPDMESKVVHHCEGDTRMTLLNSASIGYLARSALPTTDMFLSSKITLRVQIISLWAAEKGERGMVHQSMDCFTATLGIPSEVVIQEKRDNESLPVFPGLVDRVKHSLKSHVPDPNWIPVKQTLLALSAPERPSQLNPLHPVLSPSCLDSEAHRDWTKHIGSQILYVHGVVDQETHDMADMVFQALRAEFQATGDCSRFRALSFTFDSAYPLRDSLHDMVTSFLIQSMANSENSDPAREYHFLNDLFLMRCGWSAASCLSMFQVLRGYVFNPTTVLLLHDFDECDPATRAQFLDYYAEIAERSESQVKIVVTSRTPNALLSELQSWPKLDVDDITIQTTEKDGEEEKEEECFSREAIIDRLTSSCPLKQESDRIRNHILEGLASMDATDLRNMLQLLEFHTGWPRDPSKDSLSRFISLLELVIPSKKPGKVLDRILRSTAAENEAFSWTLSWVLCGYRPLTRRELSTAILSHRSNWQAGRGDSGGGLAPVSLSRWSMEATSRHLESWLRVLVDFSHDEITIRREISSLLTVDTDTDKYLWNEVRRTAHQTIAEFCVAYLALPGTLEFLSSVLEPYESRVREQLQSCTAASVVPPITPDGQEIAFYAVQALPYHLRRCPASYSHSAAAFQFLLAASNSESSAVWAKAHWAMSNPLSRTQYAPDSALPVLFGLDMASYEDLKDEHEVKRIQCIVAAAGNGKLDVVSAYFNKIATPNITDSATILTASVQSGDEVTALRAARAMQGRPEWDQSKHLCPPFVLWAACWLNMPDLVEMLLSNGMSPNVETDAAPPEPSPATSGRLGSYTSPLYMVSILGHAAIARILLARGARTDLLRAGRYGSFHAACHCGHSDMIREYIARDRSLLSVLQPNTGLYVAASWGNIKVVETLLDLGAEVNGGQGGDDDEEPTWSPLAVACRWQYPATVELLLRRGADVNCIGPYNCDTPLWFAACRNPSVEVVRVLLRHSADPSHKLLDPPLITEIAVARGNSDVPLEICDLLIDNELPVDVNATNKSGETALMIAAEEGKLALVSWLRKHGADVDKVDNYNRCALQFAVSRGHIQVVEELLKSKPQLEVFTTWNSEPLLHEAFTYPDILKLLLAAGADPNVEDGYGMSLINRAVSARRLDVVEILIENKADIDHKDSFGWAPISDAIAYMPEAPIVRLLADSGAKLDFTLGGGNLVQLAIGEPLEIPQILLEFHKAIDINHRDNIGRTALHLAARASSPSELRLLIKAGADVNAQDSDGKTPLHVLAQCDNKGPFLSLLLEQPEIEVNSVAPSWGCPLHVACRSIKVDNVRVLIEAGADVEPDVALPSIVTSTPLMAALLPKSDAIRGRDSPTVDKIVRMLVFKGASVQRTVRGSCFYTALSAACYAANVNTLNFLLDEGASTQLIDPIFGRLPLHFAAANGIENFQAVFLAHRGDMMVADREGKNCLHWAAQCGNTKTVDFILSKLQQQDDTGRVLASYINRPDSDGWTPLCWAARPYADNWMEGMRSEEGDFAGVVRLLLRYKADRAVRCRLGLAGANSFSEFTPLDLAQRCDADVEILKLLKDGLEEEGIADSAGQQQQRQHAELEESPLISVRRWAAHSTICNFCLNPIFGLVYRCQTCVNFDVCTKCLPHREIFHTGDTQGDGKEHVLLERPEREEYLDPPLPLRGGGAEPPDGPASAERPAEDSADPSGNDAGGDIGSLLDDSDEMDELAELDDIEG
ncbi:hypothetical protein BHE90_001804 [Fusarium euwallaceae]|uniref:ZZ-type domain-containing protein n=1 Tax=Fusarium euwallaceae TaxID=1147111 RepID=A0A430M6N8_9HYPO|nr:hypothetical protein BHE90_001804 [Fusarium euwallaceae]